jgi:hypothetical protein
MLTDLISAAATPQDFSTSPGDSSREVHKSKTITLAKLSEDGVMSHPGSNATQGNVRFSVGVHRPT